MTEYIPLECTPYLDVCTFQSSIAWITFILGLIIGAIIMHALDYRFQLVKRRDKQ